MRSSLARSTLARASAALLALTFIKPLWAAPGDITKVPAPMLGSDPPKARDIADGDASVSTQTGALQYSLPISVPPGRQGMAPQLALTYSSQASTYGGVASGWSLSIPEIRVDTSESVLEQRYFAALSIDPWSNERYVSTLSGSRPLVPVTDTIESTVYQAYRAQNDSGWIRYERMKPGQPYTWRARTPDGTTHYFGDAALGGWSTNVVPLTRSVDSFGNTIEYQWSGYQISQIRYTSNPSAGLPAFARVEFNYVTDTCGRLPVGSAEDRRLDWIDGEKRLTSIKAVAFDPSTGTIQHQREYTLGYDSAAKKCTANHAPIRILKSVQQKAWGPSAPLVTLPPVTFQYNRLERTFGAPTTQPVPWLVWNANLDQMSLSAGQRPPTGWPGVDTMMLDFDGDGLVDRITRVDDPVECQFMWEKNRGRNPATGHVQFEVRDTITMPRLPWQNAQRSSEERCTLNYQFTKRGNLTDPAGSCQDNQGSYLAYRWLDVTGDGRVDLVAAIHHDFHYDPNQETDPSFFANLDISGWPACEPDGGACPALSSSCVHQALVCERDLPCHLDDQSLSACLGGAEPVTCDRLMRGMDQYGYDDPDQNPMGPVWPPGTPPPGGNCGLKKEHERCDRFPWMIYENTGGAFSPQGQVKLQPIPLESDGGESAMGGGGPFSSNAHALQDMDGDGFVDLVVRGRYKGQQIEVAPIWWFVFRGDGSGGFQPDDDGRPYVWYVPEDARITGICSAELGTYCQSPGPSAPDHFAAGITALSDLNGDGVTDFVWSQPEGGATVAQAYWGDGGRFANFGPGANGENVNAEIVSTSFVHADARIPYGSFANFMTQGWRQAHTYLVDVDQDGRSDLVSSKMSGYATNPWPLGVQFNDGGSFLDVISLGDQPALQAALVQRTTADDSHGPYEWATKRDLVDLDGDGLPEFWNFDDAANQQVPVRREQTDQPMRLLKRIDNGRGGSVDILYASTNSPYVIQDADNGKALPRTQWVVRSLSVNDLWDPDVETTTYAYEYPVWNTDERGRWGFRGFESVITTDPSGARTVQDYGYDVDWSGRLVRTRVFSTEDPAGPRTISETTWAALSTFGGAVETYHTDHVRNWTCRTGQTEAQCKSTGSGFVHTWSEYQPLPATGQAQLHYQGNAYTSASEVYAAGDRRHSSTQFLLADAQHYQLQETASYLVHKTPLAQEVFDQSRVFQYDSLYRVRTREYDYFSTSPLDYALTTWSHDPSTGVLLTREAPRNAGTGQVESYTYDTAKRFVTSTVNEVGHTVEHKYDPGTGALLTESGPNFSSCGSGCTNWEQTWTDIDGLGRPLATWSNVAVAGNPVWQKTKVSRFKYTDVVSGGLRTKVEVDHLIDYGGTRWTHEETRLDGQGRPDVVVVTTGGNANAVTSYDYDHRGQLVSVTLPDPSQNSAATVTYTYAYDSIGRPTSMRRPATGGAQETGLDLGYDGIIHERTEVNGGSGPAAHTTLVHDVFGRLVEVRESLDGTQYASTFYEYDANDNVNRITNPDDVVTEMFHDFAGRRTRIERAGRVWLYGYGPSGELDWEQAPSPPGMEAFYTNSYFYDAIGREHSRSIGARDLTGSDPAYFGVGLIGFGYDGCANGVGRLCSVTHPSGVLSSTYTYDAEGNPTSESRTFNFGGVTGTRGSSVAYGPGGRVVTQTYADGTVNASDATRASFAYDDRAMPSSVQWLQAGQPARTVATQTRNVAGLVILRNTSFATPGWNETFSYWAYDKLTRVTSQTIISSASGQLAKQQLDYFGQDDPRRLQHWMGATYYDLEFGFDARHQLTSVDESAGRFTADYTFSPGGKLTSASVAVPGTPGPGSDVIPRSVSYVYSSLPGIDPEAPVAIKHLSGGGNFRQYSYDVVGNMLTRSGGPTNDSFAYDGEDQLRRATVTDGTVTSTEEYFYDHTGARTAVVTRGPGGSVTNVRVFLGDSELVLSPTGSLQKSHASISLGTPVARVTNRAELELQYHGLSNNTLISVKPDGTLKSGFVYAPYGELLESTGTAVPDQHRRFNDKFRDDLTSLSYYGVRYYDGLLLGWTQADPLYRFAPDSAWGDPRRGLLYQFSLSNPVRYLDPDGRNPGVVVVPAAGAAILLFGAATQTAPKASAPSLDGGAATKTAVVIAASPYVGLVAAVGAVSALGNGDGGGDGNAQNFMNAAWYGTGIIAVNNAAMSRPKKKGEAPPPPAAGTNDAAGQTKPVDATGTQPATGATATGTKDTVVRGPGGAKKHTPGRGHNRKSAPQKKKRFQQKAEQKRKAAEQRKADAQKKWDSLTDEQKKLLPKLNPATMK